MRTLMFVGALAAAAAGCTLDDPSTGETTQEVVIKNRLASNRLASNRLASNRLASNRLASNALSSSRLVALGETATILSDDEGRDVYSYIISCALPAGVNIEFLVPGDPIPAAETACVNPVTDPCPNYRCTGNLCTFFGNLGLAPRWADHKLGQADRGWVSACLFARVNASNTAEAISLRGRNDGLLVADEERGTFGLQEGAFYGNLFTDDTAPAPDWNACRGSAKASSPTLGGLSNRRCAEENTTGNPGFTYCGFKYAGDCADFPTTPSTAYACDGFDADATTYSNCRNTPVENGRWKRQTNYRQVITSYVSGSL